MKLLERKTGTSFIHVPYRGGGPLGTAAATGEVDLPTATGTVLAALMQGGSIRALASTGSTRASVAPDAPTLKQAGILVEAEAIWAVLAPTATPAPIRARMETALRQAPEVPSVEERLGGTLGVTVAPQGPEGFGAFLVRAIETWGKVVRENGIKAD